MGLHGREKRRKWSGLGFWEKEKEIKKGKKKERKKD